MSDDWGNVQVYLGDGRAAPQRARLVELVTEVLEARGWRLVAGHAGEREIAIARPDRWVTLLDSLQLERADEHEGFCAALSRDFPLVSLRGWGAPSAPDASVALALYRDGAVRDRLTKGAAAAQSAPSAGPAAWADLLGSQRNAARLELAWSTAPSAQALLATTAEIVGFDGELCWRGGSQPRDASWSEAVFSRR